MAVIPGHLEKLHKNVSKQWEMMYYIIGNFRAIFISVNQLCKNKMQNSIFDLYKKNKLQNSSKGRQGISGYKSNHVRHTHSVP